MSARLVTIPISHFCEKARWALERFTAADLTFAALAAPMLLPASYGSPLPPADAMPPGLAREVERLRAHPAGAFADRLYNEERVRPVCTPT